MAGQTEEAYAMLRVHCAPPDFVKRPDAARVFYVDVPVLRKQLPLYLGRARKGKDDTALREYGERAEAIRATKANSLLMAHRRSTLSKRQFCFSWDAQQGCIVLKVCGSTTVNVNGEVVPQNSSVPLRDFATIITASIVIQFCPAKPSTPSHKVPVATAAASNPGVPTVSTGLPAGAPAAASASSGEAPPKPRGVKRARSGAMREELEAVLQQWKQGSGSAGQTLTKATMLGLMGSDGDSSPGAEIAKKKRLDRQVRDFVKKGVLVKDKPSSGKVPATYRVV